MDNKSTPIGELLNKQPPPQQLPPQHVNPIAAMNQAPPNPVNTSASDAQPNISSAKFAQMPGGPVSETQVLQQGMEPKVGGPGQGISSPLQNKKEFFGLKDTDYKSTVVVFALILIFSSNIFFELLKTYLPAVMNEGKVTLVGSLIGALVGAIVYIIIKCIMNLN